MNMEEHGENSKENPNESTDTSNNSDSENENEKRYEGEQTRQRRRTRVELENTRERENSNEERENNVRNRKDTGKNSRKKEYKDEEGNIRVIQQNLGRGKTATDMLAKKMLAENVEIACVQEPYRNGSASGITTTTHKIKAMIRDKEKGRACILISESFKATHCWIPKVRTKTAR